MSLPLRSDLMEPDARTSDSNAPGVASGLIVASPSKSSPDYCELSSLSSPRPSAQADHSLSLHLDEGLCTRDESVGRELGRDWQLLPRIDAAGLRQCTGQVGTGQQSFRRL